MRKAPLWLLMTLAALAGCAELAPPGAVPGTTLRPVETVPLRVSGAAELAIASIQTDSSGIGISPGSMVDGNGATAWINGVYRADTSTVVLTLSGPAAIAALAIKTGVLPTGSSYDIDVSDDGTTWTPALARQTGTTWSLETKPFPPGTTGRYVRLTWHNTPARSAGHFAIYEIAIRGALLPADAGGPPDEPAPPVPGTTDDPGSPPSDAPPAPSPLPTSPPSVAPPVAPSVAPSNAPGGGIAATALVNATIPGRAIASSGNALAATDGDPSTIWQPSSVPAWLALPLARPASGPLVVVWDSAGFTYLNNGAAPRTYDVQVSADSTDGRNGHWATAFTAADNPLRSRADFLQAPGATWVRVMTNTRWGYGPALRRFEVYAAAAPTRLDSWLILGDSITAQAFDPAGPNAFTPAVTNLLPGFAPVVVGGGTGGDTAANGLLKLGTALPLCPPGSFVGLAYGTNDATHGVPTAVFKGQVEQMVQAVLASGRTPMLARTPHDLNPLLPAYVAAIDALADEYGLPPGPDLYGWFTAHPEEIGPDTVHPTLTGRLSIQRAWAGAVARAYGAR